MPNHFDLCLAVLQFKDESITRSQLTRYWQWLKTNGLTNKWLQLFSHLKAQHHRTAAILSPADFSNISIINNDNIYHCDGISSSKFVCCFVGLIFSANHRIVRAIETTSARKTTVTTQIISPSITTPIHEEQKWFGSTQLPSTDTLSTMYLSLIAGRRHHHYPNTARNKLSNTSRHPPGFCVLPLLSV